MNDASGTRGWTFDLKLVKLVFLIKSIASSASFTHPPNGIELAQIHRNEFALFYAGVSGFRIECHLSGEGLKEDLNVGFGDNTLS